jgi:hypothetical protein
MGYCVETEAGDSEDPRDASGEGALFSAIIISELLFRTRCSLLQRFYGRQEVDERALEVGW